jgi:hypothetical protein
METIRSFETSVLTRATRRNISEDDVLDCTALVSEGLCVLMWRHSGRSLVPMLPPCHVLLQGDNVCFEHELELLVKVRMDIIPLQNSRTLVLQLKVIPITGRGDVFPVRYECHLHIKSKAISVTDHGCPQMSLLWDTNNIWWGSHIV